MPVSIIILDDASNHEQRANEKNNQHGRQSARTPSPRACRGAGAGWEGGGRGPGRPGCPRRRWRVSSPPGPPGSGPPFAPPCRPAPGREAAAPSGAVWRRRVAPSAADPPTQPRPPRRQAARPLGEARCRDGRRAALSAAPYGLGDDFSGCKKPPCQVVSFHMVLCTPNLKIRRGNIQDTANQHPG